MQARLRPAYHCGRHLDIIVDRACRMCASLVMHAVQRCSYDRPYQPATMLSPQADWLDAGGMPVFAAQSGCQGWT